MPDGLQPFDLPDIERRATEKQAQFEEGVRQLQRSIRETPQLARKFRVAARERAPVERQIAAAGRAFRRVGNPLVRRQLLRQAETTIRGRRAQDLQSAQRAFQQQLQAQQTGLGFQQQALQNLLAERSQARQFAAQQFQNELNFQRQQQLAASRGGGGGRGRGRGRGRGSGSDSLAELIAELAAAGTGNEIVKETTDNGGSLFDEEKTGPTTFQRLGTLGRAVTGAVAPRVRGLFGR